MSTDPDLTTLGFVCQQCGWAGEVPAIVGSNEPSRTSPLLADGQAVCPTCGMAFRGVVAQDSAAWQMRTLNRQRNPSYPTRSAP